MVLSRKALPLLGEDSKQKTYTCVIWLSRQIDEEVVDAVSKIDALPIQQRTPIRVLHRRTNCVRTRSIISAEIELIPGQKH